MWLMSWLYLGTFGSFIGYSAGLPLLIKSAFPHVDPVEYAFLGPLVGALVRPLGGWMSDKLGGARVTLWNFIVMTSAVLGVVYFMPSAAGTGSFWGFLAMFMVLFFTTGIGNGSTFRMIPVICLSTFIRDLEKTRKELSEAEMSRQAGMRSAAVLGFSSALAAYGAFFIPKSFGTSIALTGSPLASLYMFLLFYATCIAVTWWYYARKNAEVPC